MNILAPTDHANAKTKCLLTCCDSDSGLLKLEQLKMHDAATGHLLTKSLGIVFLFLQRKSIFTMTSSFQYHYLKMSPLVHPITGSRLQ